VHSVIVVVNVPDRATDWDNFTNQVAVKVKPGQDVRRLAENVWQVNFQKAPIAFSWLIVMCDRLGYECEILQLEDAPQWLKVGFDPKTI
jgi:hypothetical protein